MKTFSEIEVAIAARETPKDKLSLIYEWVKTGVINKIQFMSIIETLVPTQEAAEVLSDICQDHQGSIEALTNLPAGTKLYASSRS